MRLYELFHTLYDKFVPTDETVKMQMKDKAGTSYAMIRISAEDKNNRNLIRDEQNLRGKKDENYEYQPLEPLTMKEKFILFCDSWVMMYVFGILYVIAVPYINRFITGEIDEQQDESDKQSDIELALEIIKKNREK